MTQHLELLVEEPSAEAFLRGLLPRLLPPNRTFEVYPFQGKQDLLDKLEARLRGYAAWLPAEWRIVVVVDRDDDDCRRLKQRMEQIANRAGLRTKDWEAVRAAFPRVSRTVPRQSRYREPDAITGGTWEAFERILQRHGYFKGGLPKIDVARVLGQHVDHTRCHSPSFVCFRDVVLEAVQ
jgi:hypothetical protein